MKKNESPEIPAALANVKRLSSEDWEIRSVSIWGETDRIGSNPYKFAGEVVTGISLEAELVPWTKKAMDEISSLVGQCFFVCDTLFQIRHWEYAFDPCDSPRVAIKCRSIWSKPKAESRNATLVQALALEGS